jgi:hypothetical protein
MSIRGPLRNKTDMETEKIPKYNIYKGADIPVVAGWKIRQLYG